MEQKYNFEDAIRVRRSVIKADSKKKAKKRNQIVNGCELSDEQQEAVDKMKKFCSSEYDPENWIVTLTGGPGTGKSLSMRAVIEYMDRKDLVYKLCAPTHKAKYVLSTYSGKKAETIHSLFRFSPMFDVQDFDYDDIKFNIEEKKKAIEEAKKNGLFGYKGFEIDGLPYDAVIIIDEASMISTDIFEYFKELSKPMKMKMIMIGDPKQIRPVNEDDISPVFREDVKEQIRLTKVFRQDNESALLPTLLTLRERKMGIIEFKTKESPKGSLRTVDNIRDFMKPYTKIAREAIAENDVDRAKIICYTNKRVVYFNILARLCLFKDEAKEKPLLKGEFLMGSENFQFRGRQFYNSSDYMIVDDPKRETCNVFELGLKLPCWSIELYSKTDGWKCTVPYVILSEQNDQDMLYYAMGLEEIRMSAIAAKKCKKYKEANLAWTRYFNCLRSFACDKGIKLGDRTVKQKTFTYGYAISAHKSQGSSYGSVFVDIPNILLDEDEEECRELQYVSLSRARKDAYILTVEK